MKRQMTSSEPVEGVFVRRAAVSWTLCDCENLVPAEWGDERLAHPGARSTEMPKYPCLYGKRSFSVTTPCGGQLGKGEYRTFS
jgi:hypothetical protein